MNYIVKITKLVNTEGRTHVLVKPPCYKERISVGNWHVWRISIEPDVAEMFGCSVVNVEPTGEKFFISL